MNHSEIALLMEGIAPVLRGFVDKAFENVSGRLTTIEKRLSEDMPAIAELRRELGEIVPHIERHVAAALAALPKPIDVASLELKTDPAELKAAVEEAVAAAMAVLPVLKDGASVDPVTIKTMVDDAVAALPKAPTAEEVAALVSAPEPGKDATPEQIAAAVEKVLATWERPKDGDSVTIEQLRPLVDETVAKRVAEIPAPKGGAGLAGVLKDDEGCLVFTLTDGKMEKLGRVDGQPGKDGAPGRDVDPEFVRAAVREEVKQQVVAPLIEAYKGVWRDGQYRKGDIVTWAGSLFIASADTDTKPEANGDWRLAVKRGRDGKDGRDLGPPPPSPPVKLK